METKEERNIRVSKYNKKWRKNNPWVKNYTSARNRCTYPINNRYSSYGGRGIKFSLSVEEVKKLWFRDKAYLLKIPSIDRKDIDGDYTYRNCRFIEKRDNLCRCKPVFRIDKQGRQKRYSSISEASRDLSRTDKGDIARCMRGERNTAQGFSWKECK